MLLSKIYRNAPNKAVVGIISKENTFKHGFTSTSHVYFVMFWGPWTIMYILESAYYTSLNKYHINDVDATWRKNAKIFHNSAKVVTERTQKF